MSDDEVKTFKTFKRCVTEQTWNVDLSYIPFDKALWSELFVRVKHSCRPISTKNQLEIRAYKSSNYYRQKAKGEELWLVEDVKDVYPGVIFDRNGRVKKNPIHVIVPKFEPSGLQGLLEMFFYRLIIYNIGGCHSRLS